MPEHDETVPVPPDGLVEQVRELGRLPHDRRRACLEQLCAQHSDHADQIRALFLLEVELASPVQHPDQIGPYKILEPLGQGGMGTVYLAAQQHPIQRQVALKLIRVGMDSERVLARFEAERQALAMMNHDNIARIHDAGQTEQGQPYFVMEYVPGPPLTEYCDAHRLGVEERLLLFQKVCAGVQHAHQKGIIHRDLKPSNVLVADNQGRPVPKVIDFGLARATDPELVRATLFATQDHVVGTPLYMSPEQAEVSERDIDTRTDIYSLGVMLYELLVGWTPFAARKPRRAAIVEIQRRIREEDAPTPSTQLTTHSEDADETAKLRSTNVAALTRQLRGDLDRVVLKAMQKDPGQRYATAQALADDLQRYLHDEPVVASPPTARYRLKKFVKRYRVQVAAVGLVVAALVSGAAGTTWFMLQAQAREREAHDNLLRFNRLAVVVRLNEAEKAAKALFPAWPERIGALRAWLEEHGGPLVEELPRIRQTRAALRARALPQSERQWQLAREAHPLYPQYLSQRTVVSSLQRAMDVRMGKRKPMSAPLPPNVPEDPMQLVSMAWPLIDPRRKPAAYGREDLGLRLAREAVVERKNKSPNALWVLAWALFATGQDAEAKAASGAALRAAPADQKTLYERDLHKLGASIDGAANALASARARLRELESEINLGHAMEFEDPADRFLYEALQQLEQRLAEFAGSKGLVEQMQRELDWARRIDALSRDHPNARFTWADAAAAVRKADGLVASKLYGGAGQPIDLKPQVGLVPIGMNPQTKLWEFYHLRSAWNPEEVPDPAALEIPTHREDGAIDVGESTGIVFVLLPGGTFTMGAQNTDHDAPNYDPLAGPEDAPHRVTLSPFLLARHEMTQGQWLRLSGQVNPSHYRAGVQVLNHAVDQRHPVEMVTWLMADQVLRRHGLLLPTEAQWEYGCRATTTTPWHSGTHPESLDGCANILDVTGKRAQPQWPGAPMPFSDGHAVHAPVGSFRPNRFGLHDMHGNVCEWCRDWRTSYGDAVAPGDGLRDSRDTPPQLKKHRIVRGGSYDHTADRARSAFRTWDAPTHQSPDYGLRAARPLIR